MVRHHAGPNTAGDKQLHYALIRGLPNKVIAYGTLESVLTLLSDRRKPQFDVVRGEVDFTACWAIRFDRRHVFPFSLLPSVSVSCNVDLRYFTSGKLPSTN